MGLREKVALILFFNTLLQVRHRYCLAQNQIPSQNESGGRQQTRNVDSVTNPPIVVTIRPQARAAKARNKFSSDRNQESLQKTFNFPDVEYPTASTPRPPFYLQETNILQRNPMQRAADYPTSSTVQYPRNSNKNDVHKSYNSKQKQPWYKTTKKPGVMFSEYVATPQPYYFRDEGAFPDVEYPLNARDTWKPNYWNQIPVNRPQSDINKNALDNSNIFPPIKSSKSLSKDIFTNGKNSVSKLLQTQSLSGNQKNVNNNHHQPKKEELGQHHFTKTDSLLPKNNEMYNNQHTTSTPPMSTQSTSSFVLTPYTTLYFDSTSPSTIEKNHSNSENKSISPAEGKKRKKKKIRKKNGSTSIKPSTNNENYSPLGSLTTPMPKILETDSHEQKDFAIPLITSEIECSNVNESKKDTCPYKLNDILPTTSITPSYLNNDTSSSMIVCNDDETPKTTNDKTVASISNDMNTILNTDNESLLYLNNTGENSSKSSIIDNKSIEFPLSCREDVVPTDEEEFTTDSFPDFDEDVLSMYNLSTSTLSPLNTSPIDNTWSNSKVIEFLSESLLYPDELDQFYIMVP